MTEVFISYSRRDIEVAKSIVKFLRSKHYVTWRDEDNLPLGGDWTVELERAINRADVVLVLLSEHSVESEMVRKEAAWAKEEAKKPVIPVILQPNIKVPLVIFTEQRQAMFPNFSEACDQLHRFLEANFTAPKTQDIQATVTVKKDNLPASDPAVNPFSAVGSAVHESHFVGRQAALTTLRNRLSGPKLASTVILGERRMGKTSLLNYVMERNRDFLPQNFQWAFAYIDMMDVRAKSVSNLMEVIRESIARWTQVTSWKPSDDGDLKALAVAFQKLAEQNIRLVLCFDEFEKALSHDTELADLFDTLRSAGSNGRIAMIAAVRTPIDDLFNELGRTSPFANIFVDEWLRPMADEDWQLIVRNAFQRTGLTVKDRPLKLIGELSGGHPYLVQLAGYAAWEARDQDWIDAEPTIRELYDNQARKYFKDLWLQAGRDSQNALQSILKLPDAEPPKAKHWRALRERGLITKDNSAVFCGPFADYIRDEVE